MGERWVLAIDFGTSFTSAAMVVDGRVEVLEIDGLRRLPSVVLWLDDELVVGTAAETQRVLHPQAAERNPKRYLGVRKNLLLGGHPVPVVDAAGAVLGAVYEEALRRSGGQPPAEVRLTHPARWPAERLDALRAAAASAGVPSVALLAEPVAAAMHYGGNKISAGEYVAVYDLGGGTFDTAVLRRVEHGFELAGPPGGDDRLGGEDFDHRLMDFVIARLAVTEPDAAIALRESDEIQWRRAASQVLLEARQAKEALSRQTSYTMLLPPPLNQEMRITRPEFEALIRADVQRTIDEFGATIEAADLGSAQLTARYLAGGSSRIPLVSRLLQEAFDAAPDTYDDPKVAVALGAAQAADPGAVTRSLFDGNGAAAPPIVALEDATVQAPSPLETTGVDVLAAAAAASLVAPELRPAPPAPTVATPTLDRTEERPAPPDADTGNGTGNGRGTNGGMPSAPPLALSSDDEPHEAPPAAGKKRSDPKTRRLAFVLGAGLFVLAIITGVLIVRASSGTDPKPTAQLSFATEDVGFASLDRTWTVDGDQLNGTLTFANAGSEQSSGRHNEVFPKSMVSSDSQITSDPTPSQVVKPDPILGYDLVIPAGGTATITYHVAVPPGTDDAALARWKDEARTELTAYQAELTKKPTLVLPEPSDQTEVGVAEVLFRGNTDPGAQVDISGTSIPVNTDGTFSHLSTEMAEGPTTFVVTATGANGQTSQVIVTVTYVPPPPPPVETKKPTVNAPQQVIATPEPPATTPPPGPGTANDTSPQVITKPNVSETEPVLAYSDAFNIYPCYSYADGAFMWTPGIDVLANDSGPYDRMTYGKTSYGNLYWDQSIAKFEYQSTRTGNFPYTDSFTYFLFNSATGAQSTTVTVTLYVGFWTYC